MIPTTNGKPRSPRQDATIVMRTSPAMILAALAGLGPAAGADTPVELGAIAWLRDHAEAQRRSRASSKPMLLLFQEVPG